MKKSNRIGIVRRSESISSKGLVCRGRSKSSRDIDGRGNKKDALGRVSEVHSSVYIGPSIEGINKKYVKVLTGEVEDRRPSFV
jgi:hypothetical protein